MSKKSKVISTRIPIKLYEKMLVQIEADYMSESEFLRQIIREKISGE